MTPAFQNNQTPGSDGIPIEFYKRFWHLIEEPFISCVNECFEKGELACSQKQAVLILIEKKGKDRLLLENWRPISLLNVDVKIMSKVIATEIKNVLPSTVHHNQTGFINDRYIGETVRSIFDLIDFTLSKNIPRLLIFIDFHKAFDCLEWNFLFSCLNFLNFGPDFIRWVEIFYKNIHKSCVINNGFASDFFALERGKELNRLVYKFLWNGPDKKTRLSTINDYAKGGLRMIDLDCMIKSLRLAWLQRIYDVMEDPWKWYLSHLLTKFGGLFLFNCNYDVNDLSVPSLFSFQLLKWWSEFREDFASVKDWHNIIWNNRDIRIDGSPVFYKNFFLSGVVYLRDLLLNCNNIDSFARNIEKSNFLIWTGLRDSIPFHLKDNTTRTSPSSTIPSFSTGNGGEVFCVNTKKSRDYYLLLISKKSKLPNAIAFLHRDFNLSEKQLQQAFLLPHKITLEPYVKAFQYKVLNRIMYTNDKLYKIGFISHKDYTFCKSEFETLTYLLFHCPFSIA